MRRSWTHTTGETHCPCSRSSTSPSATGPSSRSTARRSRPGPAASSASSARTAPARRRRCAASSGWPGPIAARSAGTAGRSTATPGCASATCPSSAASTRGCASASSSATSPSSTACRARRPMPRPGAWLERIGLADRAKSKLEELSHGNQQRIQLATALVHDPELLVLDEPFSGLDPIGIATMTEVLRERAAAGVGVVFSSHQLDLVEDVCEDVVIIARGRIVAVGRDRRAQGRVGPAAPRGRGRRHGRRVARRPRGRPRSSSATATGSSCSSTTGSTSTSCSAAARAAGEVRRFALPAAEACRSCSWRRSAPDRGRAPGGGADEPLRAASGSSPGARSSSAAAAAASSSASLFTTRSSSARSSSRPLLIGDEGPTQIGVVEPAPAGPRRGDRSDRRRCSTRTSRSSRSPTVPPAEQALGDETGRRRRGRAGRPVERGRGPCSTRRPTSTIQGVVASAVVGLRVNAVLGESDVDQAALAAAQQPPTVARARPPQTEATETAVPLRQHRRGPDPRRHLLLRLHGPDRRRRGEAEPGRRGRPVDRPAARPADGQGPRHRHPRPRPAGRVRRGRRSIAALADPGVPAAIDDRRARSSMLVRLVQSSATRCTRPRSGSSARSPRGWRRPPTPRRRSRWSRWLRYFVAIFAVINDPSGTGRDDRHVPAASAPFVVPLRAALGAITPWQIGCRCGDHDRGHLGAVRGRRPGLRRAPPSRRPGGCKLRDAWRSAGE